MRLLSAVSVGLVSYLLSVGNNVSGTHIDSIQSLDVDVDVHTQHHHRLHSLITNCPNANPLCDKVPYDTKHANAVAKLTDPKFTCADPIDLAKLLERSADNLLDPDAASSAVSVMQQTAGPTEFHYWYRMSSRSCLDIDYADTAESINLQMITGCYPFRKNAIVLKQLQTELNKIWKLMTKWGNGQIWQFMSKYAMLYFDEFNVGQMFSGIPSGEYANAGAARNDQRILLSALFASVKDRYSRVTADWQARDVEGGPKYHTLLTGDNLEDFRKAIVKAFEGIDTAQLKRALVCYPALVAAAGLYNPRTGLLEHTYPVVDMPTFVADVSTENKNKVAEQWQLKASVVPIAPIKRVPNFCGRLAMSMVLPLHLSTWVKTTAKFPPNWASCTTAAPQQTRCRFVARCVTEALRRVASIHEKCRGAPTPADSAPMTPNDPRTCKTLDRTAAPPLITNPATNFGPNGPPCRIQEVPLDEADRRGD